MISMESKKPWLRGMSGGRLHSRADDTDDQTWPMGTLMKSTCGSLSEKSKTSLPSSGLTVKTSLTQTSLSVVPSQSAARSA